MKHINAINLIPHSSSNPTASLCALDIITCPLDNMSCQKADVCNCDGCFSGFLADSCNWFDICYDHDSSSCCCYLGDPVMDQCDNCDEVILPNDNDGGCNTADNDFPCMPEDIRPPGCGGAIPGVPDAE